MRKPFFLIVFIFSGFTSSAYAYSPFEGSDTAYTLKDCIAYAMKNQPAANQAFIDEDIARVNKNIALSAWLPQVNLGAAYQHYIQQPTSFLPANGIVSPVKTGVINTVTPAVGVTQNIFSNDALLAGRASRLYISLSKENTEAALINLVTAVSKAFYDVLLSEGRINVYKEDTGRLLKNQSDAYHRYVSGIVDKVDYKQATISLNNSLSQLKTATEDVAAKYAVLKQTMGSRPEHVFTVKYDSAEIMKDIYADTLAALRVTNRVEYRQLQLMKDIQRETTTYYRLGFLPTLSAFYNYNYPFLNNKASELYNTAYPNSYIGLQLNVSVFTGFRRLENMHKSRLQETRIDWDIVNLELSIFSEYQKALSTYKSNFYYLHTQSENINMAREVYNIVKLQYTEGIKAYLDVIISESGLQTSEINYLNALFQVMQSKVDFEKATGKIN